MNRREFLHVLGAASAAGLAVEPSRCARRRSPFTRCRASATSHLLHFTDCHAQLLPNYFREPDVNLGVGAAAPGSHRIWSGEALLQRFGVRPEAATPMR